MEKSKSRAYAETAYYPLIKKCNNNCISCVDNKSFVSREETLEQIIYVIETRKKIETVVLTHGEPTIRPDFFDLVEAAQKYNKRIHLLSNGRLFSNANFARKLLKYNKTEIYVSLTIYGHNAHLHDRITRIAGSFNETIRGIKNLEILKFKPEIRILINKINYQQLQKIADYIKNNFQIISRVVFIFPRLTGNAAWYRHEVHVSYEKSVPHIQAAIDILKGKYGLLLAQFPKCVLDREYRNYASGYCACETYLVEYFKKCNDCSERKNCSGVWINYKLMEGDKEFSPIKNKS